MHYIDEMYPWTIVDQRKYIQYVKLRKERDKFLKSIKPGWYCEWVIHKKLIEAGGIGDAVYILPARGGGTSFRTLKRVNDLLEEGRDVKCVTRPKQEPFKLTPKDIDMVRESIRQHELYAELINPWREPLYQQLFKDFYPERPYSYEPSWTIDPYGRLRIREISLVRKDDRQCP
jgi:hypothetical protein